MYDCRGFGHRSFFDARFDVNRGFDDALQVTLMALHPKGRLFHFFRRMLMVAFIEAFVVEENEYLFTSEQCF